MTPILRLATEADAESIQAIYAPIVRDTFISFETDIPSVQEMRERIRHKLEHYPWLVLEHAGNLLGYAYAGRWRERAAYDWSVEVTVYVHPDAQRGGVGRALYTSLFEVLRLQGFCLAIAVIALPNDASLRLHDSLGFKAGGLFHHAGYKLGQWHDMNWLELQLQPPPANPVRPRAVHTLVHTPEWAVALAAGVRWLRL
jgi:L-amino acid N-acyltransferase YncA